MQVQALGAGLLSASAVSAPSAPDRPLLPGFSMIPSALPKSKPAPVRIQIKGRYRNVEGDPLGALRTLRFEGDRHLVLDLEGVPVCDPPRRDVRRDLEALVVKAREHMNAPGRCPVAAMMRSTGPS